MGLFDTFRDGLNAAGYNLPEKYAKMAESKSDSELEREYKRCKFEYGVDKDYLSALEREMSRRGISY